MFNADAILNQSIEQALDTEIVPIPEGEFQSFIDKLEIRKAKESIICDIFWKIDDPALEEELGRELKVKQSIFLDMTEGGALDFGKGKNVQLGRLREALNMNVSGEAWNFGMLAGSNAYVTVYHKPSEDGSQMYANVKTVASQPVAQ